MRLISPVRFLTPLLWSIAALLALFLFWWLAGEILEGETLWFDEVVRGAVHGFASPPVTRFMRLLSDIGNVQGVFVLTLIASALLWLRRRHAGAVLMLTAVAGAMVLMWGMKLLFHRARPMPYFGIAVPSDYSFPSGHALVAVCFYGVAAAMLSTEAKTRGVRIAIWSVASLMALGIGLSRIYLGVHYPSDVIGGYLAAAVWIAGIALVYRRYRRS